MTVWWIWMFFIVLICLALHPKPISSSDDYWADDFDENKNCEKEDLLKKLSRQKNPGRCSFARRGNFLNLLFQSTVSWWTFTGNDQLQWEECKKKLTSLLVLSCMPRNINKVNSYCSVFPFIFCYIYRRENFSTVRTKVEKDHWGKAGQTWK